MMTPHDQQRFRDLVSDFAAGTAPPFYVIVIGSNGAAVVERYSQTGAVEQVCASDGDLVAPVIVTVVGSNGAGKSARIEIERPRRLQ